MKALSIRQPWAWLIIHRYKDIENRGWYTGYRGRVYVHAPKQIDETGWDFIRERLDSDVFYFLKSHKNEIATGCLVGEVDIIDCVKESDSPWFVGKWGFVLKYPERYLHPTPCRGRLGLFEVPLSTRGVFSPYNREYMP